jgi:hypothetical protein
MPAIKMLPSATEDQTDEKDLLVLPSRFTEEFARRDGERGRTNLGRDGALNRLSNLWLGGLSR